MRRSRLRTRLRPSENDPARSEAWYRAIVHPKAVCAVCGGRRALQGHHVVSQQAIVAYARSLRLSPAATQALLWDTRNGIALCASPCHERHTSALGRVPRSKLPAAVYGFVEDLNALAGTEEMSVRLEREYPC